MLQSDGCGCGDCIHRLLRKCGMQGNCPGICTCEAGNFCTTTLVLRQLVLQTHWETHGANVMFGCGSGTPYGQKTRRGPNPPEQSRFLFLLNVSVSAAFNEPVVDLLYDVGPIEELCNQGESPKRDHHRHASRAQPKPIGVSASL